VISFIVAEHPIPASACLSSAIALYDASVTFKEEFPGQPKQLFSACGSSLFQILRWVTVRFTDSNTRSFMIENIEGLQRVGGPPELLRAMRDAIDRGQAKNAIAALKAYGARRIAKKGAAAVAHKLGFT
jgi:hypothetical protein